MVSITRFVYHLKSVVHLKSYKTVQSSFINTKCSVRVEIVAGGANYVNGSFYAVGSNGVTVRGIAFADTVGTIKEVRFKRKR